jgi:hypothetical protein
VQELLLLLLQLAQVSAAQPLLLLSTAMKGFVEMEMR